MPHFTAEETEAQADMYRDHDRTVCAAQGWVTGPRHAGGVFPCPGCPYAGAAEPLYEGRPGLGQRGEGE